MKPNTPIYYYHRSGDTYPGVYVGRRLGKVRIRYTPINSNIEKTVWTLPNKIVAQSDAP